MDDVNKVLIKGFFLFMCVFVVSAASCNMHNDYRIQKAIEKGGNPLEISCAFSYAGCDKTGIANALSLREAVRD